MKDYHYLFILPNRFKVVGLIIMVATVAALFALDLNPPMPRILFSVFILGLLLVVLAKEKREDELIVRARYVSAMQALVLGVFVAIIVPTVPLFLPKLSSVNLGIQELALVILGLYTVNFYWFLIQLRYEKHD